jgi:hypothetical protein
MNEAKSTSLKVSHYDENRPTQRAADPSTGSGQALGTRRVF